MTDNKRGILFIVSAPSGAGKTTLCKRLVKVIESLEFAVSHTTRQPRAGEQDGVDYSFIPMAEFRGMVDRGEFLEHAEVHGNCYGTSKARLTGMLERGTDVLHDIDVQGARQLRAVVPAAVYVFIMPPSYEALESRLRTRGTDSEEVVARRLGNALGEVRDYLLYDYVIINDVLDRAVEDFRAVVRAARHRAALLEPAWVDRNFFAGRKQNGYR